MHAARAMRGIVFRELTKFLHQYGRLASAVVRPALWLVVFAAGMQNLFGVSPIEPYNTYIPYQVYIVPGLLGIVLLFNGMQSSLSLVYDREVGTMRLLLTAPLPRWYLLLCKLIAGTLLSIVQCYAFLAVAHMMGISIPWSGWLYMLPALLISGLMLGSIGLLLSIAVRQLENFAGTMNFVIFPMFFLSSALYPLWRLRESGASYLYVLSNGNPFTHAVELVRYAAYGKFNGTALLVVIGTAIVCFLLAARAYDPQRGFIRRRARP
ncbi:multidrug ABC transporter permease [Pelagibacterium lacus]|uniref:Transport permease protein n=1 Tax=Pelagibacterium lacus TaxID=2282655 RepID=A0A369W7H4_9HYPH|nr:ABC transporter permease [Pelagibacterium lacus]RDE09192.1 multidrug ABC transporter permease [Pelagibacterium lacus]